MRDGWEEVTIGEIAEVVAGSTPSTREPSYWGGDIAWITPSEITRQEGQRITRTDRTITEAGLKAIRSPLLPVNTVLLTSRATVGAVALAGVPMAINQGFAALVAGPRVLPEYLMYWCQANRTTFEALAGGSTFPEVGRPAVRSVALFLPPLAEQRRIVDLIGAMDDFAASCQRVATSVEAAVAAGRADWLPWDDLVPLSRLCSIEGRLVDPTDPRFSTLPHIGVERIESRTGRLLRTQSAAEDGVTSGKYLARPGDVVYSKIRPELRKAVVIDFEALVSADAYPLTPGSAVNPDYLLEVVLSHRFSDVAVNRSGRTKMPKVNRQELMTIPAPRLSADEQFVVGERFGALRKLALAARTTTEAATRLRSAVLSDLLSGEHEIPATYDRLFDPAAA